VGERFVIAAIVLKSASCIGSDAFVCWSCCDFGSLVETEFVGRGVVGLSFLLAEGAVTCALLPFHLVWD